MIIKESPSYTNRLFYIILFAAAMGFFEAALVVHLRELLYPEGFSFPFKIIPLPWIDPVIAPVLITVLMIVFGVLITRMFHAGGDFRATKSTWLVACAATAVILFSFMRDFDATLHQQLPQPYWCWLLFVGLALYCWAFFQSYVKSKKSYN